MLEFTDDCVLIAMDAQQPQLLAHMLWGKTVTTGEQSVENAKLH